VAVAVAAVTVAAVALGDWWQWRWGIVGIGHSAPGSFGIGVIRHRGHSAPGSVVGVAGGSGSGCLGQRWQWVFGAAVAVAVPGGRWYSGDSGSGVGGSVAVMVGDRWHQHCGHSASGSFGIGVVGAAGGSGSVSGPLGGRW
jgi:hypothetical protein